MSHVLKTIVKPLTDPFGAMKDVAHAVGIGGGSSKKAADPIAGPPTADLAAQNLNDRLGRRRGALATIFGGSSASSTPTVMKSTLGGS